MLTNARNPSPIAPTPASLSSSMLLEAYSPRLVVAAVVLLSVVATVVATMGMIWNSALVLVAVAAGLMIAAVTRFTAVFMIISCAAISFPLSLTGEYSKMALSTTDALSLFLLFPLLSTWMQRRWINLGPAGWPLALYFAVCTLSTLTGTSLTWGGLGQAVSLGRSLLATLVVVAVFGNLERREGRWILPHLCFLIYLLGMPVMTVVMLWLLKEEGFQSSMYAFGMNKNGLGPALGCGVAISLSYLLGNLRFARARSGRLILIAGLILSGLGLVVSLSRGAWIATAAACLFIVLCTRNIKAFVASFLILVPLLAVVWKMLPEQAVSYATNVSASSSSIQERFNAMSVVMNAFRSNPLLGVGVGLRKDYEPHDVLILTLGETGIVGLAAFCLMFVAGFYTFFKARRYCQGPGDRQLLVTGAAILLLSLTHGMMDVYWRRGIGVFGWIGVGFAVAIMNRPRNARVEHDTRELVPQ
jgi:O-antigen ligase